MFRPAIAVAFCGAVATAAARGRTPAFTRPVSAEGSRLVSHNSPTAMPDIPHFRPAAPPVTRLPRTMRDLFAFRHAARAHTKPVGRLADEAPSADVQAAPAHVMRLVGIATDGIGVDVVRTAIVTVADDLFLVKEGEFLPPRYLVLLISENSTDLRDLGGGANQRLTLK